MAISNSIKATFSHHLLEHSFNQNQGILNNSHKKCVLMKRRGRWHHQGLGSSLTSRYAHVYLVLVPHTLIPYLQHCCTVISLFLFQATQQGYMGFPINL